MSGRMVTVVLRELPSGAWHATSITNYLGGTGFADDADPFVAISHCLGMAGVTRPGERPGTLASQYAAQLRLHAALDAAIAARKAR